MSNQSWPGVSSLVLNEPLLWEKGRPGRVGVSLPESDVPAAPYEAEGMVRTDLNLPTWLSWMWCATTRAFHVELRCGHGHVSARFLHHEIQSQSE